MSQETTIRLFRDEADRENPYVRAILRYGERQAPGRYAFQCLGETDPRAGELQEVPTVVIRPFSRYVSFAHPGLDLEGYATYFSGHGVHVPPVVSAILTHLEETGGLRGHHRVVGSGIGIYLAAEMKKRGTVVTLMSHRQLLDRFHERGGLDPEEGIVNCSRVSVPGCVVNLSDNPREISRLTVQYLFRNLRALEGTAP